ncbi:MAG: ABC transporter ATP-binding protein [Ruminococcaceae bacterium]|nr:ABC transporter ATP-binding protein [Oscillospiraceae bacterium]
MDNILQTVDLTKKFGPHTAVDKVNMCIKQGEIYGFIGRNGAGKTTFMRTVLGLANATSGSFFLFGEKPSASSNRKIGALIEAPGLYGNCTAYENMKRFAILFGSTDEEIKDILEFVGLSDTANKKVDAFSLGMKQRLGIAVALLGNPEFMILDEPVNGLDPAGMKEVRDLILKLNTEKQMTFLISSHLLDELSKIATKYGIINNGRLIDEFTTEELAERCRHRLTITVDDTEKALELLTEIIPADDIKTEKNDIVLFSHIEESARLNRLLVENGIEVSGLTTEADTLEKYFMERIGV